MAEEITYIPYGLDEISQQDLMTSLANGVPGYLDSKRWAKKDKYRLAWLNAYLDIMGHGLLGASNSSGLWNVQYGQDPIDLSTKSNIEREMYQDAAYYIQLQMSLMPLRKKEEEKKKEELEQYNFTKQFLPLIYNNRYGGNPDLFASEWENLDERNDKGLRGTDKRKAALIEELNKYRQNLIDNRGKYNFEGTAFKNEDDVIRRIDEAVAAIQSPDLTDDNPKLNALGLSYNSFFSNGGNDIYGTVDGKQITYQLYYEALDKQKEAEAKAKEEELKKKKLATYNNTLFFNRVTNPKMLGQNAQALKNKYKDTNSLVAALQAYAQKDIKTLTPDEQSEVQGAYRYLANQPIDSVTLKNLQSSSSGLYKGAAPNRFRKIKGIDNLIWDNDRKLIIQINSRQLQEAYKNQPEDLFANVKTPTDKELEYLNSKIPGITNAEWKELSAIGLDIASIINPEAVTGSGMALTAAGLRHSAKNDSNPDWSFGDYIWQGIDYLTGALGGILVLGDLTLSAKTMATASKALPILRKIARAGAWYDLVSPDLVKDLMEASRKITSGEELTVKDWRAIGLGIRGLVSHGRLNRGNRAERRVLEKSGQNVTPENVSSLRGKVLNYSLKLGFTRTKPTNTSEVSVVKATVNGKESEIEISSNAKAKIQEKVLKAGNNTEARNKAVKEVLESEGKIKASDKIEVEAPTYRDGKYAPGWLGTSKNLFGTKQVSSLLGNDVFNDYISGNRSYWDRYKYGSDTELKGIYNRLNINNNSLNNNQASNSSTKTTETKSNWSLEKINKYLKNLELMESSFLDRGKYNPSSKSLKKIDLSKDIASEKYSLADGKQLELSINNGILNIKGPDGIKVSLRVHDQLEIKKIVSDVIKNYNNSIGRSSASIKRFSKEYIESLKELRRKGYLFKLGGTINPSLDTIIEDFFKNNNI